MATPKIMKTTEYLQHEGCFAFHRAANAKESRLCERESVIFLERHMFKAEWNAVNLSMCGRIVYSL